VERVQHRCKMAVFSFFSSMLIILAMACTDKAYALTINGGASYTNTPDVTLQLNMPSGTYQVDISNEDGPVTTISSPSSTIPWTLSAAAGTKTVTVKYYYTYPYSCQVSCGSYCCGGYSWGTCDGWCTQYCSSTC
jgi:hypothetical protein